MLNRFFLLLLDAFVQTQEPALCVKAQTGRILSHSVDLMYTLLSCKTPKNLTAGLIPASCPDYLHLVARVAVLSCLSDGSSNV